MLNGRDIYLGKWNAKRPAPRSIIGSSASGWPVGESRSVEAMSSLLPLRLAGRDGYFGCGFPR